MEKKNLSNEQLDYLINEEEKLDRLWEQNEISDADYLKGRKMLLNRAKEIIYAKNGISLKCKNIQDESKEFIKFCLNECEKKGCSDGRQAVRNLDTKK